MRDAAVHLHREVLSNLQRRSHPRRYVRVVLDALVSNEDECCDRDHDDREERAYPDGGT
jgi:hypothetical protein